MIKSMIDVYYRLVKSGVRTLDSIPAAYREAVAEKLRGDTEETPENGNDDDNGEE